VSGIRRPPELAPARLGELQRSVLDPSLAGRELGWRAERALHDGLTETWKWVTG
jgi:UDP-glucose 4-epimerase